MPKTRTRGGQQMFEYAFMHEEFLREFFWLNYPTGRRYGCIEAPFMIGDALHYTSLLQVLQAA